MQATHRTFFRNIGAMAGATAVSQGILFLTSPFLTRLYDPKAVGLAGSLFSLVLIASVTTGLRLDQASVGARTDADAYQLAALSLLASPLTATISALVLVLTLSDRQAGGPGILPTMAWMWLMLVLYQGYSTFRYLGLRGERFGAIGLTTIMQQSGRALFPLAAAPILPGAAGLLLSEVGGIAVGASQLARNQWQRVWVESRKLTRSAVAALIRGYRDFPIVGVPSSLLNAAAQGLALPLIATTFGAGPAGQFALAARVVSAPATLVGRSVSDAFYARIALLARERPAEVRPLFLKMCLALLVASIGLAVLIVGIAYFGFNRVFGTNWGPAGRLAIALLPSTMAALVVSPVSSVVLVLGGQLAKLGYDIATLGVLTGVITCARVAAWPLERTVWAFSAGQATAYLFYFGVLLHLVTRLSRSNSSVQGPPEADPA